MNDRSNFYRNFSISLDELDQEKFRHESKDKISKYESKLKSLVDKIVLWETYLSEKQVNIVKMFLSSKNASMVDDYLKLPKGTSWHILFGEQGENGVLGKLIKVEEKLYKLSIDNKK